MSKADRPGLGGSMIMRSFAPLLLLFFMHQTHAQSILGGGAGGDGAGGSLLAAPLGMLAELVAPEVLLNTDPVVTPRDFEPRLLVGLGVNVQQANVVGGTLEDERSLPWVGAVAELGFSLTYRDRIGMAVQGSWGLTGYLLWPQDTVCYDVYHTSKRAEANLWWLIRCKSDCPSLRKIGLAAGYTFQEEAELNSEEDGFAVRSTAAQMMRPYLAPELGFLGAEGKDRFELSLRYVVHIDGKKAITSTATSADGEATYNASDNYLGLVMRYHIGFKRSERATRPLPMPEVVYAERITDTLSTLGTCQERITLRLWDNAEEDGDTISIILNDRPVLTAHELTHKPLRLTMDLAGGANRLLIVAHNEGRVSPNTASCIVRRGKGKEEMLIRTSEKMNQLVVIQRE